MYVRPRFLGVRMASWLNYKGMRVHTLLFGITLLLFTIVLLFHQWKNNWQWLPNKPGKIKFRILIATPMVFMLINGIIILCTILKSLRILTQWSTIQSRPCPMHKYGFYYIFIQSFREILSRRLILLSLKK